MSKSTFGWRQAGFTAVATALVFGGTLVGAGAASAASVANTFTSPSPAPSVVIGQNAAPAGDLAYEFDNSYAANSKLVFTLTTTAGANVCTSESASKAAIGFSAAPTMKFTTVSPGTATAPTATPAAGTLSSTTTCATYGIQDVFTVNIAKPSVDNGGNAGTNPDRIKLALTAIEYNVGSTAAKGSVTVTAGSTGFTPTVTAATAVNATVVDTSFSYSGFKAVTPNTLATSLGTATITELRAGASFATGTNPVTLTLGTSSNVLGGTPTVTASTGHTITGTTKTANVLTFTVTTVANAPAATITVSGLTADAGSATGQVALVSSEGSPSSAKALNVVDYGNSNRLGGDTRYDTAAALFNATAAALGGSVPSVVLSGGQLFPDALSANYLAGALGTATLLTPANTLSSAARNAILDSDVDLVYITGDTAAVSQGIQDQIESLHAGNNPSAKLIATRRLGGDTRYDTNKIVNTFADSLPGSGSTNTVLLSSGENFPDALAFGPIAYSNTYPLVLTKGASLSAQASSQLAGFDPNNVVISGQTDAVSSGVASSVSATGATVSRLGGLNRSETATMIAEWATTGDLTAPAGSILFTGPVVGFDKATVNFTWTGTPQGFGDALAAGPLAGHEGSVILLASSPTTPGDAVTGYLGLKEVGDATGGTFVGTLRPLGGVDVTSNTLMKASAASIQK